MHNPEPNLATRMANVLVVTNSFPDLREEAIKAFYPHLKKTLVNDDDERLLVFDDDSGLFMGEGLQVVDDWATLADNHN